MEQINKIAVIYGDGIGPEIIESSLDILSKADVKISIDAVDIGGKWFERGYVDGIPDTAWETIRNNKVILKAPITTPQGGGYKSINVTLRKSLGLYANVRPCKSYHPYIKTNFPKQDLVIIRENEEDSYTGVEYRQTKTAYHCLKMVTRPGCERISKFAFDYALRNGRKKITCMMKDNIMKMTDGIFHKVFDETAKFYPEITSDQMIIDIGTAKIAAHPEDFDVVVTTNLYGDIISDVAAEISGSVGVGGSANIGDEFAMFEAIHGSAPDIAGKNIANPTGLINAIIMMLEHMRIDDKALLIKDALHKTIEDGIHTGDIYNPTISSKKVGTKEFANEVITRLGEKPKKFKYRKVKKIAEEKLLRNIDISKEFPLEKQKDFVGIDVVCDVTNSDVEDFAKKLQDVSKNTAFGLQFISSRGIKIWPVKYFFGINSDCLRCRFIANTQDKKVTHSDLIKLLGNFTKEKIDFIRIENLYLFNGELGFRVL